MLLISSPISLYFIKFSFFSGLHPVSQKKSASSSPFALCATKCAWSVQRVIVMHSVADIHQVLCAKMWASVGAESLM